MKKARFVWDEHGPKLQTQELSHCSFQHEMARYFSNVGNKLQMMIKIGKVCGFTSNFDIPKPFTTRKNRAELTPRGISAHIPE